MGSNAILTLNEDNFDQEIKRSEFPIVVDFWASWCPPCKVIAATLEQIAGEFVGRARIGKVDIDDNGDLANRFGIRSIPTLVVFKQGKVVDQLIGAAPKDQVRRLIDKHLA